MATCSVFQKYKLLTGATFPIHRALNLLLISYILQSKNKPISIGPLRLAQLKYEVVYVTFLS